MHSQRIKIFFLAMLVIIGLILIFPKWMSRPIKAQNSLVSNVLADSGKEIPADSARDEVLKLLPQVHDDFFKLKPY